MFGVLLPGGSGHAVRGARDPKTYINGLPRVDAEAIEQHVAVASQRLLDAGLDGTSISDADSEGRRLFIRDYFRADVPCPLLDGQGTCAVRPVRPLACREYLVTSDPTHCATADDEQVVRVRVGRDVVRGFQAVSAAFDEPKVEILAFALAEAAETTSPPGAPAFPLHPAQSGVAIVQLLTSKRTTLRRQSR